MFLASLDIKTAFDEARPRRVEQIMEGHDAHGWIISALLREMAELVGQAMFVCKFSFCKHYTRQESGHAAIGKRGRSMGKERNGIYFGHTRTEEAPDLQPHVGRQLLEI